jgi:2-oxoisovalerate dehydrogenase E1 component alpha subunit
LRLGDEGKIGFVPVRLGSEAAVIGATAALRTQDWIFPSYGDFGAALLRGMPIATLCARAFGGASDPLSGHEMAGGLSARAQRIASSSAPAATHLPHAVGFAWAANRRGEDLATAAFFDAPEIDAADFHTGLNFAGVLRVPTIFVCRTSAGEASAAEHAVAYGLAASRCDGSDLLAVVRAVCEALERARQGRPTILDLAIGGPDAALSRARAHVEALGAWDGERERAARRKIDEELASAVESASRASAPDASSIFDHVYAGRARHLEEQRAELERS